MKVHFFNGSGMACNKKIGKDSDYPHSSKVKYVTCGHCRKSLAKGAQMELPL